MDCAHLSVWNLSSMSPRWTCVGAIFGMGHGSTRICTDFSLRWHSVPVGASTSWRRDRTPEGSRSRSRTDFHGARYSRQRKVNQSHPCESASKSRTKPCNYPISPTRSCTASEGQQLNSINGSVISPSIRVNPCPIAMGCFGYDQEWTTGNEKGAGMIPAPIQVGLFAATSSRLWLRRTRT